MARKYPEWTSDKDLMLLCAAHVHRDATNGYVKWERVAAIVAQGVHSPKSCCGRHTHLIKSYSEVEKALEQAEDLDSASGVSTPASNIETSRITRQKPIRAAPVASQRSSGLDQAMAEGSSEPLDASRECDVGGEPSQSKRTSKETSKAKEDAKDRDGSSSKKSKKRSATDNEDAAQDNQDVTPSKKRKKKRHVTDSATDRQESRTSANGTANMLRTPTASQPQCRRSSEPLRGNSTTPIAIPTAPSSMRAEPHWRHHPALNNHQHHGGGWNRRGRNHQPYSNGGDMRWMDDVLQKFKRGMVDALKHEMGLG